MFATPVYAAASGEAGAASHGGALFSILGLEVSSVVTTMWGVMFLLFIVSFFATRTMEKIPQTPLQNAMELILEVLLDFLTQVMGNEKAAKRCFPLLASFFLMILASNYSGLLPGAGHIPGLQAPTSTLSVTAAFAIIVFFAVHYYGIKANGLKYFKHYIEPVPILLPMNILEQFTRPLSLALRLYGNIFGEEMVVASLFALVPLLLPLPIMLLGLLFGFIQALVFTLLATLYLSFVAIEHH